MEVSIRLGYNVPCNYESTLGKAVKRDCADLILGKSPRFSSTSENKIDVLVYPSFNKRVENSVRKYCDKKGFTKYKAELKVVQ